MTDWAIHLKCHCGILFLPKDEYNVQVCPYCGYQKERQKWTEVVARDVHERIWYKPWTWFGCEYEIMEIRLPPLNFEKEKPNPFRQLAKNIRRGLSK